MKRNIRNASISIKLLFKLRRLEIKFMTHLRKDGAQITPTEQLCAKRGSWKLLIFSHMQSLVIFTRKYH